MEYSEVIRKLHSMEDPAARAGMARYGINPEGALGVSVKKLRELAKEIGKDHALAQRLWDAGIHEARILATIIDVPEQVTEWQMERWVKDFDSWDICDQCCNNLFDKTRFATEKATIWCRREEEFVRRAGFTLIATIAVHDKKAEDRLFEGFLALIEQGSLDERNYVRKAVNWALRQIGKRNEQLNEIAIAKAERIYKLDSKSARWVASDALRELRSDAVQKMLRRKNASKK